MGVVFLEFYFSSESDDEREEKMRDIEMVDILYEERRFAFIMENRIEEN